MESLVMNCRFCNANVKNIFADLGNTPFANSFLSSEHIEGKEQSYPLCAYVCSKCFLVQVEEFESPDSIFTNYAYFASYSKTWLFHVKQFVENMSKKFSLNEKHQVIEIASNDGYLLQFFKELGIKILGIEPAANVAQVAKKNGIPTITKFFGSKTAEEIVQGGKHADFLIVFNVLPHVPNLNDFVKGLKILLKEDGVIAIQFSAYLLKLIEKTEVDTIYHEHFSYFSLITLQKVFAYHGLIIFDVEEMPIHGGSLRLYLKHSDNNLIRITDTVQQKIDEEKQFGLNKISTYENFQQQITSIKENVIRFFSDAKIKNKKIVGYGAAAKGNTFLNYCNIGNQSIEFVADISPHKQGLYLPGTHIPIYHPDKIMQTKPDYVIILAWNLKEEIIEQMKYIREWGGKFVVFIPETKIL